MFTKAPPEYERINMLRRHDYTNEDGTIFGRKDKEGPRDYKWYLYEQGNYKFGLHGAKAPIYRLHRVVATKRLWLVEGEHDVDTLESQGIVATCGPNGASWDDSWADYFDGKEVYICGDNDVVGVKYRDDAARCLNKCAAVKIVRLPISFNDTKIKDVTDYFEATGDEFKDLLEQARLDAKPFTDTHEDDKKQKLPKIRDIFEYADNPPDPKDNLLGSRFLCRQGSMLFVAQSGIGKSSASVQQDILWSIGKPAFGIKPSGPLKILTIQAEDDEGDMHEFTNSVKDGMELNDEEVILANRNCKYVGHKELTGLRFLTEIVGPLLEIVKPDLLRLNPLQAYLGADIGDPFETGKFLRNTLNPLLEKYNCGCIIVHHTPKTTYQNKEEWKTSDWMYACTGSADITNWGRSILVVTATNENDKVFAWIAAKRTNRIGWCDDDGVNTGIQYYKHGDDGSMLWLPCEDIDKPQPKKRNKGQFEEKYNQQQILDAMDFIEPKRARALQKYVCENTGMSKSQFYDMWNPLKETGKIIEEEGQGWKKLM